VIADINSKTDLISSFNQPYVVELLANIQPINPSPKPVFLALLMVVSLLVLSVILRPIVPMVTLVLWNNVLYKLMDKTTVLTTLFLTNVL